MRKITESKTRYVPRDRTPENISDILENIEQHIGTPIAKATDDFIREQIEQLLGRIDTEQLDEEFSFEQSYKNKKSSEIAKQIKDLMK
jgi:uncharacterized FAD-dependent dehydrogenase